MTDIERDIELVSRAKAGDQDAFTELYRLHLPHVRSACMRILRVPDVEDVCQDVFLHAFTRLAGFNGHSRFRTWITRIAINRALMRIRKRRQMGNGDGNLVALDDCDGFIDRHITAENPEMRSTPARIDVQRALVMMATPARDILVEHYVLGLSLGELATRRGCAKQTVSRRVRSAVDEFGTLYGKNVSKHMHPSNISSGDPRRTCGMAQVNQTPSSLNAVEVTALARLAPAIQPIAYIQARLHPHGAASQSL